NTIRGYGESPKTASGETETSEIVKLLLKKEKINLNKKNGFNEPLAFNIGKYPKILKAFIEGGFDVNLQNGKGGTLLVQLVDNYNEEQNDSILESIKMLLDAGANSNMP